MKYFITLLGLFLSPLMLCSQGNLSTELNGFNTLQVSGNINLEILMASSGRLDFEEESQLEQLDVELLDNVLKIKDLECKIKDMKRKIKDLESKNKELAYKNKGLKKSIDNNDEYDND